MCLSCYLFIIGLVFYGYIYSIYLNQTVLINGDSLTIWIRDCKVEFEHASHFADKTLEAQVISYKDDDTLTFSDDIIKVLNPNQDVDSCLVKIKSNLESADLMFVCEHNCWIEQKGKSFTSLNFQVLSVPDVTGNTDEGRLKLKSINVSKILIDFIGTVTIKELESSTGGAFNVTYGDL